MLRISDEQEIDKNICGEKESDFLN